MCLSNNHVATTRQVDQVAIRRGDGVINACFLSKHYAHGGELILQLPGLVCCAAQHRGSMDGASKPDCNGIPGLKPLELGAVVCLVATV